MMIQKLLVITLTVLVLTVSSSRNEYADAFAPSSSSSLSAVTSSTHCCRCRQLSPFPTKTTSTAEIYRVVTSSRNNGQAFGAAPATTTTAMFMAADDESSSKSSSNLPFWLDPNTRGGAIVLSLILFIIPFIAYSVATGPFGVDEVEAGKWIGVGFTAGASFLWVFTYIFRVATKDMTYVRF